MHHEMHGLHFKCQWFALWWIKHLPQKEIWHLFFLLIVFFLPGRSDRIYVQHQYHCHENGMKYNYLHIENEKSLVCFEIYTLQIVLNMLQGISFQSWWMIVYFFHVHDISATTEMICMRHTTSRQVLCLLRVKRSSSCIVLWYIHMLSVYFL